MTQDTHASPVAPAVLSADDLLAADFAAPLRGVTVTGDYDLSSLFGKARHGLDEASPASAVYALMSDLCGISMDPNARGDVWGPLFAKGARRSAMPEDYRGAQSEALADVLTKADHPALRARLADVVWTNDRTRGDIATHAVNAYCECAEGLRDGAYSAFTDIAERDLFEAIRFAHRALQIARLTSKRGQLPDRPKAVLISLYEATKANAAYHDFVRVAELGLDHRILGAPAVATDAEALAGQADDSVYPMAVHGVWMLAARLHESAQERDGRQHALMGAVRRTLAMGEQMKSSAAAQAGWVMDALQELRHVDGEEELKDALEVDLRRLQKASLKEMGTFKHEIDVKEEREAIEKHFSECSLAQGLMDFAILDRSRKVDVLRKEALESLKRAPLSGIFAANHIDDEGRVVSRTQGVPLMDGEPDEAWFNHTINQGEHIRRVYTVAGRLHPARLILNARFSIAERHFEPIVTASPFVPRSQAPIMAHGFARLFQGDFISATHLLLPQIEPCMRHVLKNAGHDPSKRRDDATEEDLALSGLYDRLRPEINATFGEDLAYEIERLFTARPGPALRHDMAHGQISAGACFAEDVYYANWLLYRITCLPLLSHWSDAVRPGIEANL